MAAGFQVSGLDVNNQAGRLVTALWEDLDNLRRFHLWITDATHADPYLANLGITGTDLTDLKNGISDLGNPSVGLYAVSHGTFNTGAPNNYFATAKKLSGVTYAG